MAKFLHRNSLPARSASVVNAGAAVRLAGSANEWLVLPCATVNVEPFGIALATAASQGVALPVLDVGNVEKVIAGGSVGAGADVGVGSDNGLLAPVAGGSGAVGPVVWSVGKSLSAAAAGEYFSVYIRPTKLSGV